MIFSQNAITPTSFNQGNPFGGKVATDIFTNQTGGMTSNTTITAQPQNSLFGNITGTTQIQGNLFDSNRSFQSGMIGQGGLFGNQNTPNVGLSVPKTDSLNVINNLL